MKIGILVNVLGASRAEQTTACLAWRLAANGHDVHFVSPGYFSLDADEHVRLFTRSVDLGRSGTVSRFVAELNGSECKRGWIDAEELDVFLLRSNPFSLKDWAEDASLDFARMLVERGVLVLNDPSGLARAANKVYLQGFPEQVRPRTLVTRRLSKIASFLQDEGTIILKPLRGFGGRGVFKATQDDKANLEQIVRSISRDGYVIAQEYLPAAAVGDTRLFLMNGLPLTRDGRTAVVSRRRTGDDLRSNIHSGGSAQRCEMNDDLARVAASVRDKLVADGMFFVGLDVVGDKLLEINVFSPGGLGDAQDFEKVDFTGAVVTGIERKAQRITGTRRSFENRALATEG